MLPCRRVAAGARRPRPRSVEMPRTNAKTVDEYIEAAPAAARPHLRRLRSLLREVAPAAEEKIKWGAPVMEEKRILFSYSAHKTHLNFMPTGPALEPFEAKLAGLTRGKDTIQLPYDEPIPEALVREIAAHRATQEREHDARWMY